MNGPPVRVLALAAALCSLLAPVALAASPALAHGNPEISVSPNPASAGGKITVDGMEFDANEEISLVLEGVSGEAVLGTAMTDDKGDFHFQTDLPASAGEGSYRVRAQSSDATALVDLRITPVAGAATPSAAHEKSTGFHSVGSTPQVIALSAILALFAIAGAGLLLVREKES